MQGFEHNNHDLFGIQAGMEILGLPARPQSSYHHLADGFLHKSYTSPAEATAAASLFPGDGTLSLFSMKQTDPLQHSFVGFHLQQPAPPQPPLGLRNSKYWRPAQDLLKEFCNLIDESSSVKRPREPREDEGKANNSWCQSMHLLELQKMRARLVSMLEEVDKRYATYTGQMRAVVEVFESVAGEGSARAYSALASKAMSRHFRCLRDAIAAQIAAVKRAMGEKGGQAAPGATRGETPRLKLLDQCLRQRMAFQQGLLEPHPWRPQRGLPERAVSVLRAWLFEHFLHPYPSDADKVILARQTGLSRSQVSNWFINARVRLWKPMVEQMYTEEMKELDQQLSDQASQGQEDADRDPSPNSCCFRYDQKPPPTELFTESESVLSSIITGSHQRRVLQAENYDSVGGGDLGFSYGNGGGGGGGNSSRRAGVSLTLGLQHHNGGGMSLSLLPNSHTTRVEDDEQVHFSILDGDAVSLPYRNLMGAQLLHDFAG